MELTESIELFWVTCGRSVDKTNLIEEVSWLDYGHRGMQVIDNFQILQNSINLPLCPYLIYD